MDFFREIWAFTYKIASATLLLASCKLNAGSLLYLSMKASACLLSVPHHIFDTFYIGCSVFLVDIS